MPKAGGESSYFAKTILKRILACHRLAALDAATQTMQTIISLAGSSSS